VPDSDGHDVDAAVAAAARAFPAWSALTRQKRSEWMLAIAQRLEERLDGMDVVVICVYSFCIEFAEAESKDQGKTVALAKTVDIPRAIYNFRYFAGLILYLEDKKTDLDGVAMSYTRRDPIGVAGLISPWNLPLYLLTWKIAPAIAGMSYSPFSN
jgi:aminomuconate-semialdehyde/2-hydroxymuconate-6-semialdehyde dehydrogenase